MGSFDTDKVKKIIFNGTEYTWNTNQSPVSKWYNGDKSLVSEVVEAQNTAIRNVTFTVVDSNGYSVVGTFKADNVPEVQDIGFGD